MTRPVLQLDGLSAGYDGAQVVRDVELTVGAGEMVALLGANGAGKTTTLRAVSGLVRLFSGSVRYAGEDLAGLPPGARARRGIAHVPEGRSVFSGLTVAEHLRLGYRGERLDVEIAYRFFPALEGLRDRQAGLLSGGEQRMLAVGRALARRPLLLLLDEPSLGLAPAIMEKLLPVIRDYATDHDCGVLLVEQRADLALRVADRGYIMSHGELVTHAAGSQLRADTRILWAGYLGERAGSLPAPRPGECAPAAPARAQEPSAHLRPNSQQQRAYLDSGSPNG
jgi:ABC-type branched-subunit amino acid transport system ATPase component